jgi:hypothetical protein
MGAVTGGARNIVTNGLVLNLDAANYKSYPGTGTTWIDLSGTNRNGTLTNGPTFNSTNGGGIILDGVDDSYSVSNISLNTGSFTLECWFRYQSHSLYLPSVCHAGDYWSGDSQTGWGFGQNGGQSFYQFQMAELGAKNSVALTSMTHNTIYNFTGTRTISGTQQILRGYVNGVLVGTTTGNTIFNLSTSSFFPGYNPTILTSKQYSYTGPPPATIYNIKVYTRDLSATEILQNFNSTRARFGI